MSDWTRLERSIKTPYGLIRYGGACRDSYPNFETYDQGGGHTVLTLQRPAMKAFKAAEERYQNKTNPQKVIRVLPGTNRTCATQTALYRSDPNRYADPKYTGHTRGLAIDVDQSQGAANLKMIYTALRNEGWHKARPDDEPWHLSYFLTI